MHQFAKLVALQLLRAYKWAISPLFPPACRFVPTCSEYAMEAVDRYGALRGGLMACARLLHCHPFAHGGYDPVVRMPGNPDFRWRNAFSAAISGLLSGRALVPEVRCASSSAASLGAATRDLERNP